jgi:HEAT repeat protein
MLDVAEGITQNQIMDTHPRCKECIMPRTPSSPRHLGSICVWLFVVVCPIIAQEATKGKSEDRKRKTDTAENRAWALQKIDTAEPIIQFVGRSLNISHGYRPHEYYRACPDAIDLLIKTNVAVDRELFKLTEPEKKLHTRYRAMYVLAHRKNEAVVPLLESMRESNKAVERYLAWKIHDYAIRAGKLKAPTTFVKHLELYAAETDREVRQQMEWFFGTAKAKEAVQPLIETVKRENYSSVSAIWSLGMIGDKSAVPIIKEGFPRKSNTHYHLQALGRINTPESVDFIIENLHVYGAVDALLQTKSDKALPALIKHLENSGDSETRIAIIRLSKKDPREALLALTENPKESYSMRFGGLRELQSYDHAPYHPRILKIYINDSDDDIKRACIWLLEDSKAPGVTAAMIDHALKHDVRSMGGMATQYYLIEALNKRLDMAFLDNEMSELRDHLRSLDKGKSGQ